jgi:hypothetical protein
MMMVAMMVEQSHSSFDRKSNAKGCQPEKLGARKTNPPTFKRFSSSPGINALNR